VSASNCSSFCIGKSVLQGLGVVGALGLLDITIVAVIDHGNKAKVEDEFLLRRISVPHQVDPGKTVKGSLFFPVTEHPKRLELHCRGGERNFDAVVDLNAPDR